MSKDRSPYYCSSIPTIPRTRSADCLPSKRGANLVKSFDAPPSLVRGLKWELAHTVLELDFVGVPPFPSRYANFHQFFKTDDCFFLPAFQLFQFGLHVNFLLYISTIACTQKCI
ncbi:hypothetical protein AVEN_79390-1 [Araneus ventricosus]|uniref:Uncharacterized protein n=1 Tax=Araneus ventricosus TaxID=182803 RepID=A0A4Y2RHA9_ARAVE|nr:hypothetical protein AVEN_79390-1 [Araneus ventricosus]